MSSTSFLSSSPNSVTGSAGFRSTSSPSFVILSTIRPPRLDLDRGGYTKLRAQPTTPARSSSAAAALAPRLRSDRDARRGPAPAAQNRSRGGRSNAMADEKKNSSSVGLEDPKN